jgi:hypothetical protein
VPDLSSHADRIEIRSVPAEAPTLSQASMSASTPDVQPRRKRGLWAALAASACAVGIVLWASSRGPADPEAAPETAAPNPSVVAEPAPSASGSASRLDPPARNVEIELVLVPETASVELDGIATAENPLRLPYADRSHEIAISAAGYETERRTFRALTNGKIRVELQPKSKRTPRPKSSAPRAPGVGPVERSL